VGGGVVCVGGGVFGGVVGVEGVVGVDVHGANVVWGMNTVCPSGVAQMVPPGTNSTLVLPGGNGWLPPGGTGV
jgi:hypothetical protein